MRSSTAAKSGPAAKGACGNVSGRWGLPLSSKKLKRTFAAAEPVFSNVMAVFQLPAEPVAP